jgi:solute carrier family 13 (sodium-dependent dicarboxylate transporter), member 2/3/5
MDFFKTNRQLLLNATGIVISLLLYITNPFQLEAVANKAVAVAALMISWWVLEALPMPAVALVPLVLLPLLKISTFEETSKSWLLKNGICINGLPFKL